MQRLPFLGFTLGVLLGACGGQPEDPPLSEEPAPVEQGSAAQPLPEVPPERNPFGLSVHNVPFDEMQWNRLAWLGIGWARIDVPWWIVHRGPGRFEWSRIDGTVIGALARGIACVGILSGTPPWVFGVDRVQGWAANMVPPVEPWQEFVREAVRRYRPGGVLARQQGWPADWGVRHWEVWNEPDLRNFWLGSATDYRDGIWLPAIRILRAEDPEAKILFGGLCCFEPGEDPWAQGGTTAEVLASPESRDGMDILSLHYYPRSVDRTALQDPWREMDRWLLGAQQFLDGLYGEQRTVPIWLTETGFSLGIYGPELQELGLRRVIARILLSTNNRLRRPETGAYLLEKLFAFNSISPDFGMIELDRLYRPTSAGIAYRDAIRQAFELLE